MPNPNNPQSLNRYAYALNNPLRYTDPTGNYSEGCYDCGGGFDPDARFDFGLPDFHALTAGFGQSSTFNLSTVDSVNPSYSAHANRPSFPTLDPYIARLFPDDLAFLDGGGNLPMVSSDSRGYYENPAANVSSDGRNQGFNIFTLLDGTSGSLGPEPGKNPISADEFLNFVRNQSLRTVQHLADPPGVYVPDSKAGGPPPAFRYVVDPGNALAVIDMRHFLVVGEIGNLYGVQIEVYQIFTDPKSAFNPQDFYSNAFGVNFFRTFDHGKPFAPQLREYFQNRGQVN